MAQPIVMPKLAMAMKQGKVVEWKAAEGAWVEKGHIVMVIETEKVTYEIEAPASGFLHITAELNKNIPVNEVVAWLAESREELAGLQSKTPAAAAAAQAGPPAEKAAPASPAADRGKVKISPAAKKMAEVHGLDYTQLTGTGPEGRIVKEDVEKALAAREAAPPVPAAAAPAEEPAGETIDGKRVKAALPLTGIRGAIARHMLHSLQTSAQLTTMGEMDAGALIQFRQACLKHEQKIGVRISYTDILVYALAKILKEQPIMNSSVVGDEIKLWEDINIGVAVALPEGEYDAGLVVAVVHHADRLSLAEISRKVKDLTSRARAGRLTLDDITRGTFTLSNIGTFGSGYFFATPVINQPESAILGTGAIVDRPVVVDGQIVIRPIMNLSLTFDHRVINGAPAGKFVARLTELLTHTELLII
ncbi:MAG: dihydrolipoamide acetyltransferase family protein [Thermodesulfobacteriota bacterium]